MSSKVRNILLALMIVFIIYFEIHSCSEDNVVMPGPESIQNCVLNANDLYFISSSEGWIVGQEGTVARTTDGGDSWEPEVIDSVNLNSVYFVDSMNGWVVGENSSVYRSTDGGTSWQKLSPNGLPGGDFLAEVHFFDEMTGYILGRQGLYKTVDGGLNWHNNWLPIDQSKGAWDFSMVDPEMMFLLGSRWNLPDPELLYTSGDGAESWEKIEGTNYSVLEGIMTICFVNENTGWGAGSLIMKTEDGGRSWTTQKESATVREIAFIDENRGFAVGSNKICATFDGGETWAGILENDERIVDLRGIHFLDENYGWVTGRGREQVIGGISSRNSVLISTTDGGETWKIRELHWEIQ
ncbi:MAG: YCF48-related protein [Candidatus Krumholzibacteriales bacterium]